MLLSIVLLISTQDHVIKIEGHSPAKGSFAENEERPILTQRYAIWELEVTEEDSGSSCHGIVFQEPPRIVCRKNQLHEVPKIELGVSCLQLINIY